MGSSDGAAPAKAPRGWTQRGLCGQVPLSLDLLLTISSGFLDLGSLLILTQLLEKLDGQCTVLVQCFQQKHRGLQNMTTACKAWGKGPQVWRQQSLNSPASPAACSLSIPTGDKGESSADWAHCSAHQCSVRVLFFHLSYASHVFVSIWFNPNPALQALTLIQMSPYLSDKNFTSTLAKNCVRGLTWAQH